MRKRDQHNHEIIVKRRKKNNHDQAHGGAWKVAFADFTMAMMALFMVLWIVQPQNIARTSAAEAKTNPLVEGGAGIFEGNSRTPLDLEGIPLRPPELHPPTSKVMADGTELGAVTGGAPPTSKVKGVEAASLDELADVLRILAAENNADANLLVQIVPQGLRILIKDDQQRDMFALGSQTLHPHFEQLLQKLAATLSTVPNKLIISGHTDAVPFRTKNGYNNWNLSGDRALRARNVMVEAGLPVKSVLQVAAQADVMPLVPDSPKDGANRRIEILLLTQRAETLYRELFGEDYIRAEYGGGAQEALKDGLTSDA